MQGLDSPSPLAAAGRNRQDLRVKAEQELIFTERTYIANMTTLIDTFLNPLSSWLAKLKADMTEDNPNGPLEQALAEEVDIIGVVFANLEQLIQFNRQILGDIMEARKLGTSIAVVLERAIPFLKMYGSYISNYNKALDVLSNLEKDRAFAAFMAACEFQKACHGLTFRAYLIQPVQRIPRYKLLISEMLKYMNRTDPDRDRLQRAMTLVAQVAADINSLMARERGQERVLELQNIYGYELCLPSRYVIRDEYLTKVCRTGRRKFHFALFNDALCYGSESLRKKLKMHRLIPLRDMLVVDMASTISDSLDSQDSPQTALSISTQQSSSSPSLDKSIMLLTREKSFILQFETAPSARDWKADLCSAIVAARSKAQIEGTLPVLDFEIWQTVGNGGGTIRKRYAIPEGTDGDNGIIHLSELDQRNPNDSANIDSDDEDSANETAPRPGVRFTVPAHASTKSLDTSAVRSTSRGRTRTKSSSSDEEPQKKSILSRIMGVAKLNTEDAKTNTEDVPGQLVSLPEELSWKQLQQIQPELLQVNAQDDAGLISAPDVDRQPELAPSKEQTDSSATKMSRPPELPPRKKAWDHQQQQRNVDDQLVISLGAGIREKPSESIRHSSPRAQAQNQEKKVADASRKPSRSRVQTMRLTEASLSQLVDSKVPDRKPVTGHRNATKSHMMAANLPGISSDGSAGPRSPRPKSAQPTCQNKPNAKKAPSEAQAPKKSPELHLQAPINSPRAPARVPRKNTVSVANPNTKKAQA